MQYLYKQLQLALAGIVEIVGLDAKIEVEETGNTPTENARQKAVTLAQLSKWGCVA